MHKQNTLLGNNIEIKGHKGTAYFIRKMNDSTFGAVAEHSTAVLRVAGSMPARNK